MSYPPGIPILSPGEMITSEIADYIRYSKEKGCFLIGMEDPSAATLRVVIPGANQLDKEILRTFGFQNFIPPTLSFPSKWTGSFIPGKALFSRLTYLNLPSWGGFSPLTV
jgi:hypothetical protein